MTQTTTDPMHLPPDTLPMLICLLDGRGGVLQASRTLDAWGTGGSEAAECVHVHDLLHAECRDRACELRVQWEALWQAMEAAGFAECELHDRYRGRRLACTLSRAGNLRQGEEGEAPVHAFLAVRDVSRQRYAERELEETGRALAESGTIYSCFMETSMTGFYVIQDGDIVYCNSRFADIFGYTCEEIFNMPVRRVFPPGAPVENTGAAGDGVSEYSVVQGVRRDGCTIWLGRGLTRVDCMGESMTLGNIIDVTAQRKAAYDLQCLLCDNKMLSEQLLQTQETERKLIAAELHDSIGQSISAIKFGMENTLRDYREELPDPVGRSLAATVGKLRDTIEEVRRLSMELRPSMLEDLGLLATISWFCREIRTLFPQLVLDVRTGIEERDIPDALKVVIFRILQEALNNIGHHARAGRVTVELAREQDTITFCIADDGQGFDADSPFNRQGFGLSSMRERARLSGGELAIESAPGAGTSIWAYWPVV